MLTPLAKKYLELKRKLYQEKDSRNSQTYTQQTISGTRTEKSIEKTIRDW
jgi:hypothetical protein